MDGWYERDVCVLTFFFCMNKFLICWLGRGDNTHKGKGVMYFVFFFFSNVGQGCGHMVALGEKKRVKEHLHQLLFFLAHHECLFRHTSKSIK